MDGEKMQKKIEELEQQIAELPVGYISKKKIHGKERFYHQWTEDGKVRSKCKDFTISYGSCRYCHDLKCVYPFGI